MVNWVGNGTLSGYGLAGAEGTTVSNASSFIYAGTTDTNTVTRLQYSLSQPFTSTNIFAEARFNLSGWEGGYPAGSLPPGTWAPGAVMVVAPASNYSTSKPSPDTILTAGNGARPTFVVRGELTLISPEGLRYRFDGPRAVELYPNEKYWVLVYPSLSRTSHSPSLENDRIILPGTAGVYGRALSIWTDRRPDKPVIRQPSTGAILAADSETPLAVTFNDRDQFGTTSGAGHLSATRGYNGFQIQYSRLPSEGVPDPEWLPLLIKSSDGTMQPMQYIEETPSAANTAVLPFYLTSLAVIKAGATGAGDTPNGMIALPPGEWRIRARAFSSGHPYTELPPIYGVAGPWLDPDLYPKINTSDWSNPVSVTVPVQVPPPTPLYPTNGRSVSAVQSVLLQWQYRNTATPPYPQAARIVEMRKVGDPDWVTVYSDPGVVANTDPQLEVFLPDPLKTYIPRDEFVGPNDGKWFFGFGPRDGVVSTHGTTPANSYLLVDQSPTPNGTSYLLGRRFDLPTQVSTMKVDFTLEFAGGSTDPLIGYGISYGIAFYDENGGFISDFVLTTFEGMQYPVWFNQSELAVPPGARSALIYIAPVAYNSANIMNGIRVTRPNVTANIPAPGTGMFEMKPTNQYEWRVLVFDTDGDASGFSEPARFWLVPPPGDGSYIDTDRVLEGGTLGCGTYKAYITRQGGKGPLFELTRPTLVRWSRKRDDISDASVRLESWDEDCGRILRDLRTWAYELVIYRETEYETARVWEGPITLIKYEVGAVTISAQDVMGYLSRRVIKTELNDVKNGAPVLSRAQRIVQDICAPNDPGILDYLQVIRRDTDPNQRRFLASHAASAFAELDDMASNSGMDYTVSGRSIILSGNKTELGRLPEITDKDLGSSPIVTEYGSQFATDYYVTDGNGIWGNARVTDINHEAFFGRIELLSTDRYSETDKPSGSEIQSEEDKRKLAASYRSQAKSSIDGRYPAPLIVRVPEGTSLSPDMVASIQFLVPGVSIPVRSSGTLRDVATLQRLDSLKVEATEGKETIQVSLSPFNSTDSEEIESV